jgi:hypothetical protein
MEPTLGQTLSGLALNLWTLLGLLATFLWHWVLLILWAAWWLRGVNWSKLWPVLRVGGWAPLVLLTLLVALVWSRLSPAPCDCLGFIVLPNFWWQLGFVGMLVGSALFCGWLQGVFHWTPEELNLEPPAHADHGHAAHH